MSLSSYLKRQSLVTRLRKSSVPTPASLTSIEEEALPTKKQRRHETSSESDSSSSSSSGEESSGLPTTPTSMDTSCDDDFYAVHAAGFLTLAEPSSPASSILSPTTRDSAILPESLLIRPCEQLDPAYTPGRPSLYRSVRLPSRAPPPPPIVTAPNFCYPTTLRPLPRTRIPSDVTVSDFGTPSSSASGSSLDALLSPPPPHFPSESQGIPSDVSYEEDNEGDWEDQDDQDCEVAYDEIPLSPIPGLITPSPVITLSLSAVSEEEEEQSAFPVSPFSESEPSPSSSSPAPSDPWAFTQTPSSPHVPPCDPNHLFPPSPELRSRWSSSTLSSMHSAHATTSPKTFSFARARRYLPSPKSPLSPSSSSPSSSPSPPKRSARVGGMMSKRGKPKLKPLTVADVRVVRPDAAVAVPEPEDVFASVPLTPAPVHSVSFALPPPPPVTSPYSATAQYAVYPPPPSTSSPFSSSASSSPPSSASAYYAYTPSTPSPALAKAYITQRSPRRRRAASNLSLAPVSAWSSSGSSSAGSDAGSECSSVASAASGLRRKPIPVEMFLR
ncbi:hypothetical protein FB45DRAFT_1024805 [Roridomyces roridus]|uniref:Uncharacterized protein n=1 Tax=Roridomyces roridus TaxID=1738132 RepID=A0AAD7FT61_9AGAR|nr:hypothetical protein FB45DRAFT_1024805 [Roridomyces roridus]